MPEEVKRKVLVVEDEEFTRTMVCEALAGLGFETRNTATVADALALLPEFEPHVVLSDLDLGPGPSGADLLNRIAQDFPWIGLAVLTSHASPELALPPGSQLPERVGYIMKSQVHSSRDLQAAVESAISDLDFTLRPELDPEGRAVISAAQGEILRLIAEGYSNIGIAEMRGTTLRATESLVHRTFTALGIESDRRMNARVQAVRLWQAGKVIVK